MDTTPKYILMCEKAEEVQKGWELSKGDCVVHMPDPFDNNRRVIEWFSAHDASGWTTEEFRKEYISVVYLPRQDQLQAMILTAPFLNCPAKYWDELGVAMKKIPHAQNFIGREQLWLAFVMHEKYQKRWWNEEWVSSRVCNTM